MQEFTIATRSGQEIHGEFRGNLDSTKVIVFSHGFGVTRHSHGTFLEYSNLFEDEYRTVLFDYTTANKGANERLVPTYSIQATMLSSVIKHIRKSREVEELNIIAHSMGCIITALAKPEKVQKVVLLAAPPSPPYENFIEYFSKRTGTAIDVKGRSRIARSDGSTTILETEFFQEMKSLELPPLYQQLTKSSEVHVIKALRDEIVTDSYKPIKGIENIRYHELPGDHDFTGDARPAITVLLKNIIK